MATDLPTRGIPTQARLSLLRVDRGLTSALGGINTMRGAAFKRDADVAQEAKALKPVGALECLFAFFLHPTFRPDRRRP